MDFNLNITQWLIIIVTISLFAVVAISCWWYDRTIDEDDDNNMGNEAAHPSRLINETENQLQQEGQP
ncbi:MAG: hypothetical protein KAJ19_05020 [Gammaproteobacteria bacterium]|nr:hypothetical protein [Gammaproteobacteria bacterium]